MIKTTTRRPRFRVLALLFAALIAMVGAQATARPDQSRGGGSPRSSAQARPAMSPDAAAAAVRRATGGRVLGVQSDDGSGYRVRVLQNDGRVRTLRVDGRSGRVSE